MHEMSKRKIELCYKHNVRLTEDIVRDILFGRISNLTNKVLTTVDYIILYDDEQMIEEIIRDNMVSEAIGLKGYMNKASKELLFYAKRYDLFELGE